MLERQILYSNGSNKKDKIIKDEETFIDLETKEDLSYSSEYINYCISAYKVLIGEVSKDGCYDSPVPTIDELQAVYTLFLVRCNFDKEKAFNALVKLYKAYKLKESKKGLENRYVFDKPLEKANIRKNKYKTELYNIYNQYHERHVLRLD